MQQGPGAAGNGLPRMMNGPQMQGRGFGPGAQQFGQRQRGPHQQQQMQQMQQRRPMMMHQPMMQGRRQQGVNRRMMRMQPQRQRRNMMFRDNGPQFDFPGNWSGPAPQGQRQQPGMPTNRFQQQGPPP
ncbi:MAG: hypothetical protein D8M59_10145, partial [Planctomycetes bacterium]|nr:hypothetical protein [Planctomycetota bacterium]